MKSETTDPLLADYATEEETAEELEVSKRTLARWRAMRIGPPYTSIGRKLRYRRSSIAVWLQKQEHNPETRNSRRHRT